MSEEREALLTDKELSVQILDELTDDTQSRVVASCEIFPQLCSPADLPHTCRLFVCESVWVDREDMLAGGTSSIRI